MTPYLERIVKEIKDVAQESMLETCVKDYVDGKSYLTKQELGVIINEFIVYPSHKILKQILSSKCFQKNSDCLNDYGEPVLIAMLYAIQAVHFSTEITEERKTKFTQSLIEVIMDESIPYQWNLLDANNENVLHMILSIYPFVDINIINTLLDIALKHNVNPLNKNSFNQNAIDTAIEMKISDDEKKNILDKLTSKINDFLIVIPNNTYELVE